MPTMRSPSPNPTLEKLDKVLNKLIKEICNIPKSTANILIHLPHEDFGINTKPLLPYYINYIGKQLIHSLKDQNQLGQIYQGLTKHNTAKHGASLHPPHPKYQACS